MEDWLETGAVAAGTPVMPDVSGVTAVAFDLQTELFWAGNDQGRITSFTTESYARHTSFRAHATEVRQMTVEPAGVFSVSANSVALTTRDGVPKLRMASPEMTALQCAIDAGQNKFIVAGQQPKILIVDGERGKVVKEFESAEHTAIMRRSRLLCCGTPNGKILFRDPRSLAVQHEIHAHPAGLSDFDVTGNYLATCGYSARGGTYVPDPIVKVYDQRMYRALSPVQFPAGAFLVKFHPRFTSMLVAVSQTGIWQFVEVASPQPTVEFAQVELNGEFVTSMDISTSGEMMMFGDTAGLTHQWSNNDEARATMYGEDPPPLPPPVPAFPSVRLDDYTPLNVIGMPYYSEQLLSAWPPNMSFRVGEKARPVEPEILAAAKKIDFVGYAPNILKLRANQLPRPLAPAGGDGARPKFRSEQEREGNAPQSDVKASAMSATPGKQQQQRVPKHYQHMEIQYSKLGVEDFDFRFFNQTCLGGLEAQITNAYCNPVLQALYYLAPVRDILVAHMAMVHTQEFCLSCELGFLFRMLDDSGGSNCHASNFLRAFAQFPQASALGLLEPDDPPPNTAYHLLIQSFSRFLLDQVHQETDKHGAGEGAADASAYLTPRTVPHHAISRLFSRGMSVCDKCQVCGAEVRRETQPLVVDLPQRADAGERRTFASLLELSFNRTLLTKAWCAKCSHYQHTMQSKQTRSLPQVLFVNCGNMRDEFAAASNDHVESEKSQPFFPETLTIYEVDGAQLVNPTETPTNAAAPVEYELSSTIFQIIDRRDHHHLVAHVKVSERYHGRAGTPEAERQSWHLFNDFLVTPVDARKVVSAASWKIPAVAVYVRKSLEASVDFSTLPMQVDTAVLLRDDDMVPKNKRHARTAFLSTSELPLGPQYLCALDAEFVATREEESEIRSDGTRSLIKPGRSSLARVSVVRGRGPKEGLAFIDDYIASKEPVLDYLTKFSGISPGDLDPATSRYHVTNLKSSYYKLRALVDAGCVFVGHGLQQDFRIINIRVPRRQVIDTVDLFRMSRHRKIGLRFLVWFLLREDIQTETHDSIEDARSALFIYRRYLKLIEDGTFQKTLEEIYEYGRAHNWTTPTAPPSRQPTPHPSTS